MNGEREREGEREGGRDGGTDGRTDGRTDRQTEKDRQRERQRERQRQGQTETNRERERDRERERQREREIAGKADFRFAAKYEYTSCLHRGTEFTLLYCSFDVRLAVKSGLLPAVLIEKLWKLCRLLGPGDLVSFDQ